MQNIFEKLLDNLVVAAFIPSLAFFTALVFLFGDLIPQNMLEKLRLIFGTRAILIITMAICASFVLSYLSESIYWLYRGEFLPKWMNMNIVEKKHAKNLKRKINALTKEIERNQDPTKDVTDDVLKAIKKKDRYIEQYQSTFPPLKNILPTRFGNILSAAETYPAEHYKMNVGQIWPRLKQIIPTENMNKIDKLNNELAFLVNSSFLCIILSSFALAETLLLLFTTSIGAEQLFYFLLSMIFAGFGWLFYYWSLKTAQRYAEIFRCAFDLFRFQLIEQLRFDCPDSIEDERIRWERIKDFNLFPELDLKNIRYKHPGHIEQQKQQMEGKAETEGTVEYGSIDDLVQEGQERDEMQNTIPLTVPIHRAPKFIKKTNKKPLRSFRLG